MLKIKLSRAGKKNKPIFRLIIQEDSNNPRGKYLEKLGFVDRISKKIQLKKEKILHWIKLGAKPTPSVHNLLVRQNIIAAKKIDVSKKARLRKIKKEQKKEPETQTTQEQTTITPQ